jgi:hypothetical protein
MQLTVAQLYEAVNALVTIGNTPRMIPGMAKYKLARMHDALEPTHDAYEAKRIALVQKHGSEQFSDPEKTKSLGWGLAPNTPGFEAYVTEWKAVTKEVVEINVTPITLTMLGNDPKGLEVVEYKQLGGLVVDNLSEE